MSTQMKSLQSSVGSKSSNYSRIMYFPEPYRRYHQDESITTIGSSWIRRLCPQVPTAHPQLHNSVGGGASLFSHPPVPALLSSAYSTPADDDAGGSNGNCEKRITNPSIILGHSNTICTAESRTRTSKSYLETEFFARHLINFPRGKASAQESKMPLSFPSFGPLKVRCPSSDVPLPLTAVARPSSPPSSLDRRTLAGSDDQDFNYKEPHADPALYDGRCHHKAAAASNFDRIGSFSFGAKDSLTEFSNRNFTSYGNSRGQVGSPFRKRKEEEDTMKGRFQQQPGWLLEEHDFDSVNDIHGMRSFQDRMAGDDNPTSFHISPFSQLHPSRTPLQDSIAKKHGQQRKGWVVENSSKIIKSDWSSFHSVKHLPPMSDNSRFSAKSRTLLGPLDLIYEAPDQTMYKQHNPVDSGRSCEPTHDITHNSRIGSHTYRANCTDNHATCRTIWDPPPMHKWTILQRPDRPDPAYPDEAEEPFSYWNMGRMKRSNSASSVFPAFPVLARSCSKRNPLASDFRNAKSRKLKLED